MADVVLWQMRRRKQALFLRLLLDSRPPTSEVIEREDPGASEIKSQTTGQAARPRDRKAARQRLLVHAS